MQGMLDEADPLMILKRKEVENILTVDVENMNFHLPFSIDFYFPGDVWQSYDC